MPMQKAQLHCLTHIAAQLKENRYPNSESLVREFRQMSVEEGLEIDCSKKKRSSRHESAGKRISLPARL